MGKHSHSQLMYRLHYYFNHWVEEWKGKWKRERRKEEKRVNNGEKEDRVEYLGSTLMDATRTQSGSKLKASWCPNIHLYSKILLCQVTINTINNNNQTKDWKRMYRQTLHSGSSFQSNNNNKRENNNQSNQQFIFVNCSHFFMLHFMMK